ncbi:two-component system response regulator DesR [Micromonospora palomenae]|uniref:Two-component system response regulator DesR n=1 Tax=Micromonospora palomenae TaxID=1461247 RepID=A0A561WUP9_9ACTN|nr:two-component system response regulator DesR [Micromonospora palomenae]
MSGRRRGHSDPVDDVLDETTPWAADVGERATVRVVVVGEPGLLRTAVAAVLAGTPGFELAGECDPADGVAEAVAAGRPDLALVDLDAVRDPSALTGRLHARLPECAVVVLTARRTARVLRRALGARVRGVIAKDVPPDELIDQLRAIADGQLMIDPLTALAALDAAVNPLSEREREVAAAAARGLRTKEIAARLHLAPGTVRNHVSTLLRKTGGRSRWDAIQRAQDAGWI